MTFQPAELERRSAELYSCPDCGATLDHPGAACGDCPFDNDPAVDGPDPDDRSDPRVDQLYSIAAGAAAFLCAGLLVVAVMGDAVAIDRAINAAKAAAGAALWGGK
jgi:hypothetical protein